MNTTMADGAEQRLDAQIAEALFGQPGMSKMDVANRVRELRGDGPALLADVQPGGRVRLGDGLAIEGRARELLAHEYAMSGSTKRADKIIAGFDCAPSTEYAVRAIEAALSAQPSPGGQDALREAAEFARSVLAEIYATYQVKIGPFASQAQLANVKLGAALAAQPSPGGQGWPFVESPADFAERMVQALRKFDMLGAVRHVLIENPPALAARQAVASNQPSGNSGELDVDGARQPVGVPVAWMHTHKATGRVEFGLSPMYDCDFNAKKWDSVALYATPPAQQRGEPVAWMDPDGSRVLTAKAKADASGAYKSATSVYTVPLYPPAQAVDLGRARDEGHDAAIRYVLGYLNGVGDCGSTAYDEILNACGRERIIRSAVEDGELDFTGLGRWVEMYGSADDRALIDGKAVGNG